MNLLDALAKDLDFKHTRNEALERHVCVKCGNNPDSTFYSDAGRKEYAMSALCEPCFDEIFQE